MTSPIYLSASSLSTLASCEMRYTFDKILPPQEADGGGETKSVPLLLGTLVHRLLGAWYGRRDWRDEWNRALSEEPWWEAGFEPEEHFLRAWDIMEDWELAHGEVSPWTLVGEELPFDIEVPGVRGVRVRGFLDGLLALPAIITKDDGTEVPDPNRTHDGIHVLEFKTMGRWGREKLVPNDPQLWLYGWAARHMYPVAGIRFEAVSTYRYKEPSPEKRFKRLEVDYDQRKVDQMVGNLQKLARRAKQLHKNPDLAIRNVSQDTCYRYCDHRDRCLEPWTLEPEEGTDD